MDGAPRGYSASHAGGKRVLQQDRTLQLFPPISKSRQSLTARSSTLSSDSSRSARTDTFGSEASSMHSSRSAETATSKHSSYSGVYSAVDHKRLHACTADGRSSAGSAPEGSNSLDGFAEDERVAPGRMCPTAPPPSRVLAGPGAHFIDWYIPKHMMGSQTLERTNPSRQKTSLSSTATKHRNQVILSPLHDGQKQRWLSHLVEPGMSSLPFPPPYKPPVISFSCSIADNLHQAFQNYRPQLAGTPSLYLSSPLYHPIPPPPPDPSSLKSLLLHHGEMYCSQGKVPIPLHGSIFTHCRAPRRLFTVHPEWRRRSEKENSCNTL